jgi:hypothetical protein
MIHKRQFIIAACVLVIGIFFVYGLNLMRGRMVVVEERFKHIPMVIGDWQGEERHFDQSIYDELRADENLYRIYTNANGD